MNSFKIICVKLKSLIIPLLICLFTLFLAIFSRDNLQSTKAGLLLFANSVLPSLLPFFIATNLLKHTNIISYLGKLLNNVMRPIFNVPGVGSYAFIMGIISGYPIGAKIVSDFKSQNICTDAECERLLSFTNNAGPLFIIGTVGSSLFYDIKTGVLLLITHLLACISVGFLFRWWKYERKHNSNYVNIPSHSYKNQSTQNNELVRLSNLGEVLSKSITNAINTVVLIGGFVVLFSVILSILENSKILFILSKLLSPLLKLFGISDIYTVGFITGFIELTNGVNIISLIPAKAISLNIILCAFLIGFGGISVLLQVLSITSKSKISIKPYIYGKLLQGCFASFYTFLFLKHSIFFNLNL